MEILVANETDIPELTQVEIESKKQSIPECIEDFETDYNARQHRWQTYFQDQTPQTSKPQRRILKAVTKENKIIGYLAGHLTTRYNLDAEIQSFYILKAFQHQNIGTLLLKEFLNWLIEMNAASLCVGINPKNKHKQFYLKYGGDYLNEHWIYWQDITKLAQTINIRN